MSSRLASWVFLSIVTGLVACNESKKNAGGAQKGADPTASPPQTGDATKQDTATGVDDDNGLYTGFDGKTDFSLLVPGFRTYKAEDQSVVKIEQISVKLSEASITQLIAKEKEQNPQFDEMRFRKQVSRDQKHYRITPLKAGKAVLTVTGGRGGQGSGTWKKGDKITVYVAAYSTEIIKKGEDRYGRAGTESKRPCKSCHETGVANAPPHELGRVMEVSDKSVKQWITTGKYSGRTAQIPHAWSFESEDEQDGIVAFLRSRQAHDEETLAKLQFEEDIEAGNFRAGSGGGPRGPGNPSSSPKPGSTPVPSPAPKT